MDLFQHSVLNKYLQGIDEKVFHEAWCKFTDYFQNSEIQENIRNSKEEEYGGDFLTELFDNVLGYTKNPNPNFNLKAEQKNITDSGKADGAFIKDDRVIGVIELKGTDTTDLGKVESQAFGYKNHQPEAVYVVTSNFEKLRFYIDNAVDFEEFNLFQLNEDRFRILWLCLAKENIFRGIPKKIKDESLDEEESITKKLYKDYSTFKHEVFNSIVKLNPQFDKLLLFKKTQKLLDRFLFIFFAEDRLLLPPNSIREIIQQWSDLTEKYDEYKPLYERFKKYFNYMNTGFKGKRYEIFAYNGGLFESDDVLDQIKIDDDVLHKHSLKLSHYDFESDVSVNILGHIFEHSLNEIEEITAELEGKAVDKSKTKRKKDGVYYTPKYITKYIVDSALGKLCEEKKTELGIDDEEYEKERKGRRKATLKSLIDKLEKYRTWLLNITICDPACGSGAFLIQALDFLIAEHNYIDELHSKLLGDSIVYPNVAKSILENNLYGVDINEEAVEIAKLSLWLRTAQKGRKLTTLSNNIKCGNSLIADKEIAGEKAFHWESNYSNIFNKGGFDVIVGNPPYVDIKALNKEIVTYLFNHYISANNRINLYSSFIEKSLRLLCNNSYLSLIVPSSLLTQDSYKKLREIILENTTIKSIVRLPNESFGGSAGEVKVDTVIISLKMGINTKSKTNIIIYKGYNRISEITNFNSDRNFTINPFIWKNSEDFIFRINADSIQLNILEKCRKGSISLNECADFSLGLTPYDKYKGHTQEQIKNRIYHSSKQEGKTFRKLLAGNDIKRYYVSWGGKEWINYGDWLGAPREKRFFSEKRILIKQIIDWTDKKIWAAITNEELYNTQNAFNIISNESYSPEFLIAIINSKLLSFYHKKQFLEEYKDRFQKILIKDAKLFPIKVQTLKEQQKFVAIVQRISGLIEEIHNIKINFLKRLSDNFNINKVAKKLSEFYLYDFSTLINELKKQKITFKLREQDEWSEYFEEKKAKINQLQSEIEKTDREIDRMVYDLYGLTERERQIVEGID